MSTQKGLLTRAYDSPWVLTDDDRKFFREKPRHAAIALGRQIFVAVEFEAPPHTSTIEEFPLFSLRDAHAAMEAARKEAK